MYLEELQEIRSYFKIEIPLPLGWPLSESKLSNNGKLFNPQYRHAPYWGFFCAYNIEIDLNADPEISKNVKQIVILSDGKPGHYNQSLGIVDHLENCNHRLVEVSFRRKWRDNLLRIVTRIVGLIPLKKGLIRCLLATAVTAESLSQLQRLESVDLILSTGSSVAPINLLLGQLLGAKTVTCRYPSPLGISHFDLAILPRMYWHQPEHSNVCRTLGVPNRITPARLATFQLEDHQYLSPGRPKIGLLIGGTDRYYTIAYHTAINLLQSLAQLISTGGWQLLLSTSRRTPIEVADLIATTTRNQLDHFPIAIFAHQQLADSQGFKVEHILAYADLILVTEDSFSMVCEAASSGKPVLILKVDRTQAEWRYRKQDQIYQELVDRQIVQWAGGDPKSLVEKVAGEAQVGNPPSYLQDASLAAKAVANLLASDSNLTTRTENRSTT